MVMPIRVNTISCVANDNLEGLYILGRSNAEGKEIPSLPIVGLDYFKKKEGWHQVGETNDALYCESLNYSFTEGDIIWIDPWRGEVRGILTAESNANTLLLTERCDNQCEFCSQPPNDLEDNELYHKAALALLNFNTSNYVGLSGGEPTYNANAFLNLLNTIRRFGNNTKLHILSNGRKLKNYSFAREVNSSMGEREVLWGIPLHGHEASVHDEIAGSDGAFIDTLSGLSNLTNLGQLIELRIVPVRRNINIIGNILEFITSNYLPIKTISIMNLEPIGLARKNYFSVHVPVEEQIGYLEYAVKVGERFGCSVHLFNYPLCLLSEQLRLRSMKTISDWKNYYPHECLGCEMLSKCGGMFTSAIGRFQEQVRRFE